VSGRSSGNVLGRPPLVELEFVYEPDDAALAEAIAILLGEDVVAEPGEAA
jgi:hypothetical protein